MYCFKTHHSTLLLFITKCTKEFCFTRFKQMEEFVFFCSLLILRAWIYFAIYSIVLAWYLLWWHKINFDNILTLLAHRVGIDLKSRPIPYLLLMYELNLAHLNEPQNKVWGIPQPKFHSVDLSSLSLLYNTPAVHTLYIYIRWFIWISSPK